jgi:hypothetical protein
MHVDGDLRVIYGAIPLAAAVNNDKVKNAHQGTYPETKKKQMLYLQLNIC